jgi:hypothetical protein
MAKSKSQVVAFNAGELGKEALARVDLENYPRGAEIMENIVPLRQGGMTKMPGTEFIGETYGTSAAYLRPFVFSESQRFALEMTDRAVRIVFEGEYVAVENANAVFSTWSDESGTTSAGGGAAPDGGTGDVDIIYDDWFVGGGGEWVLP